VIAAESGANLASIGYHFGSKENLIAQAASEGLHRWLAEVAAGLAELPDGAPAMKLSRAIELVDSTRRRHNALARNFLIALARALHDENIREMLAESFRSARANVVAMLDLGADRAGGDAATVLLATFDGLLIRALLHPEFSINTERMAAAGRRLYKFAPDATRPGS
jgi:AcrR family transcriptional regulator